MTILELFTLQSYCLFGKQSIYAIAALHLNFSRVFQSMMSYLQVLYVGHVMGYLLRLHQVCKYRQFVMVNNFYMHTINQFDNNLSFLLLIHIK